MPVCICVEHGAKLMNARSGVYAIEYKDRAKTKPYKIYSSDNYVCPVAGCKTSILTGFGKPWCDWDNKFDEQLQMIKDDPKNKIIKFY